MTSREATKLLPLSSEGIVEGDRGRSLKDWAALIGFAVIQWPWLLRSLDGGRKRDKQVLLERLGLPAHALPNLGSWKADTGLLRLVADHIEREKPKLVVEFGTGASTLIVARALQVAGGESSFISFEQHPQFVQATRDWLAEHKLQADLRAVPLRRAARWPGLWYDHGELPDGIDFLLVDGPPWTIHPLTRGSADTLFSKIAPGGVVMLDDAARLGERVVARRWRKEWPDFEFKLVNAGTKGTLIGRRLR